MGNDYVVYQRKSTAETATWLTRGDIIEAIKDVPDFSEVVKAGTKFEVVKVHETTLSNYEKKSGFRSIVEIKVHGSKEIFDNYYYCFDHQYKIVKKVSGNDDASISPTADGSHTRRRLIDSSLIDRLM